MKPILFYIGSLPVYGYSFFLVLAFVGGLAIAYPKLARYGFNFYTLVDMAFLAIIGAIVGSRILYVLQYPEKFQDSHILEAFMFWQGGLVFHGGIVGTVLLLYIYACRHRWPKLIVADILMISLSLGIGLGRLGCFCYGCCYGIECSSDNSFWSIQYPADSIPAQAINLRGINIAHLWRQYAPPDVHTWLDNPQDHPKILHHLKDYLPPSTYADIFRPIYATQLIASVQGFLLCLILLWYYPKKYYDGEMVLIFGILYSCARFSVELLRPNPAILGTGFSEGQLFAIIAFLFCSSLWIEIALRKKILVWKKQI